MKKNLTLALPLALLVASPSLTFAQSKEDFDLLRAELQKLQEKIARIESERAQPAPAPATPPNAVVAGSTPGSFMLPGSNTSVRIGGFVKGIAVMSSSSPKTTSGADESLIPPTIPLSNSAPGSIRKDTWKASARESRLLVSTSTPSQYGPVTTLFEGDFFGALGTEAATNGNGFRVRHAWATIGNFGAGQYWSNAANLSAVPETVDFTPQIGIFGALRQGGFRWTSPFSGGSWSVALENPESQVVLDSAKNGAITLGDNDKILDLNGKVHFTVGRGEYEIAGAVRKLRSAPAVTEYSKTGYGISLSGFIPTVDKDRIMFGINTGKASGRMLGGLAPDAVLTARGLEGVDTNAGFLAYRHFWTPQLRSTWAYSWINMNNPAGLAAATAEQINQKFWTSHLNLMWSVTPTADVGIEFLRAYRKVESGIDGDLNRLLFMAKVSY